VCVWSLIDLKFVLTGTFASKVGVIVAVSSLPLWSLKVVHARIKPAAYTKVSGV
jgi:phospholipid-translocating ATPase